MNRYVLSPAAQADLEDIWDFGGMQWMRSAPNSTCAPYSMEWKRSPPIPAKAALATTSGQVI
jgi:hypothetical protein